MTPRKASKRRSLSELDRQLSRPLASRASHRSRALCSLRRLDESVQPPRDGGQGRNGRGTGPRVRVFDHGEPVSGMASALSTGGGEPIPGAHDWDPVTALSGTIEVEPFTVEDFGPLAAPAPISPEVDHEASTTIPAEHPIRAESRANLDDPPPMVGDPRQEKAGSPEPGRDPATPSVKEVEADLEAITGKEIQAPHTQETSEPPRPAISVESPGEDDPQPTPQQASLDRHSIFDRMAENLRYAATFDMGTVELERRFDDIERQLDLEDSQKGGPQAIQTMELGDDELVSDLARLAGSGSPSPSKPPLSLPLPTPDPSPPGEHPTKVGSPLPPNVGPSEDSASGDQMAGSPPEQRPQEEPPVAEEAQRPAGVSSPEEPSPNTTDQAPGPTNEPQGTGAFEEPVSEEPTSERATPPGDIPVPEDHSPSAGPSAAPPPPPEVRGEPETKTDSGEKAL